MLKLESVPLKRIICLRGSSQKSIVFLLCKLGEHRACSLYFQISNSRQTYRLIPARSNSGYPATITSTGRPIMYMCRFCTYRTEPVLA